MTLDNALRFPLPPISIDALFEEVVLEEVVHEDLNGYEVVELVPAGWEEATFPSEPVRYNRAGSEDDAASVERVFGSSWAVD